MLLRPPSGCPPRSRQRCPPGLFAHCLTSPRQCHLQADDRRPKAIAHADRVAEAVQLDVAEAGWRQPWPPIKPASPRPGYLDASIANALRSGDQKRARDYEENGPKLSIFEERDHGGLLQICGSKGNALQYE